MAVKQQAGASILNLMNSDTTTLSIETRTLSHSNTNIVGDVSTGSFRPIVPKSMRKQGFDVFHFLSHPGIRATRSLIKERFVWPRMNSEIKDWIIHHLVINQFQRPFLLFSIVLLICSALASWLLPMEICHICIGNL